MIKSSKNGHKPVHGSKVPINGITKTTIKNWKRELKRNPPKRKRTKPKKIHKTSTVKIGDICDLEEIKIKLKESEYDNECN